MLNVIYYFKTYRNKTHRLHYSELQECETVAKWLGSGGKASWTGELHWVFFPPPAPCPDAENKINPLGSWGSCLKTTWVKSIVSVIFSEDCTLFPVGHYRGSMGRERNCIFKGRILPLFAKRAPFSSILLTTVEVCYLKGVVSCSPGHWIVCEKMFPCRVAVSPRFQHWASWWQSSAGHGPWQVRLGIWGLPGDRMLLTVP